MRLSFHGAARGVTGSKHLLQINPSKKILLDCGIFQGAGPEPDVLNREWGFNPAELDHVIISHAHIDHIGLLPKLVKDGYSGRIYCTPATATLAKILLMDSARIQQADARFMNRHRDKDKPPLEPMYDEDDARSVFPLLETIPYGEHFKVDNGLDLLYTDCGHIIGSAAVNLRIREEGKTINLTFSGDVGRYRDMLLRPPQEFPQADYIIIESTYGDKRHEGIAAAYDKLLEHVVNTCVKQKGKLVMPAFSLGRTQEILYMLNRLEEEGRLPDVPCYVDSPLSIKITDMVKRYPDYFNAGVQEMLMQDQDVFSFRGLKYIGEVEESMQLNDSNKPCIIISSSGMAEAGRVRHHIAHSVGDPRNTILMTGYCEPESLGGRLKQRPEEVKIFGKDFQVRARIDEINSLSAHGDYDELTQWLSCQDISAVRKIFLVHGEYDVMQEFSRRLSGQGFGSVEIPELHQEFEIAYKQPSASRHNYNDKDNT